MEIPDKSRLFFFNNKITVSINLEKSYSTGLEILISQG